MMRSNCKYVNPTEFFESMIAYKPNTMLVKGVQNDYYELWVAFIDSIESGLHDVMGNNNSNKTSPKLEIDVKPLYLE